MSARRVASKSLWGTGGSASSRGHGGPASGHRSLFLGLVAGGLGHEVGHVFGQITDIFRLNVDVAAVTAEHARAAGIPTAPALKLEQRFLCGRIVNLATGPDHGLTGPVETGPPT